MKIVLITRRYPPYIGGAEKVLSYLAPALAAEGADVTVLTSRPLGLGRPVPATESPPTPDGSGQLEVIRLPTSRLRFVGTWMYMRALKRWLAKNPLDVAYVSMLKHDAYVAIEQGARRGFPVVLRPEGAGATGDIAWQSWGRFGKRIAERCQFADAFVAISPAIAEELKGAGFTRTFILSLPNGVPVPDTSWQRRADWRAEPRAVFVGRLAPEKGLDTLVAAWPAVRKAFPTARLTLVGEGPERPALDGQIARLGLDGTVTLAGKADDPTPHLRASDLFVLPSREEGMSIALLEAMALGMPLVTTSIPGNRRIVGDFKHGRLVPPDDPAALASVIIEQWNQFDRAFHMGRSARRRVTEEFSIKAVAARHMQLFRRLITEKPTMRM